MMPKNSMGSCLLRRCGIGEGMKNVRNVENVKIRLHGLHLPHFPH